MVRGRNLRENTKKKVRSRSPILIRTVEADLEGRVDIKACAYERNKVAHSHFNISI